MIFHHFLELENYLLEFFSYYSFISGISKLFNEIMKIRTILFLFTLLILSFSLFSKIGAASPIFATTNKIYFLQGENLTINGTISASGVNTLTATMYNSSSSIMNVSSTSSDGSTPNIFSITNTINGSYSPGLYFILLTDGIDTVNLTFKVISEFIIYEANTINKTGDVINVSTTTILKNGNESFAGGNFTELLNLSKSSPQTIHYGNYTIGGEVYHFVLIDQNNATVFDRLYVDDDKDFRLYNDTEDSGTASDIEFQALKEDSKFSNSTFTYLIGDIESTTGNLTILWVPPTTATYSTTDNINITILTKNSTHLQTNEPVEIEVLNSEGENVTPTIITSTNGFGWLNTTINLTNVLPDLYTITANDTAVFVVPVEAFKLFVATSDDSNQFASLFTSTSVVRIWVTAKTGNTSFNLTTLSTKVYYPNGTTVTKSKSDYTQTADGVYYYDIDLTGAPAGDYAISIIGSDGTNTQDASTGFTIQSVFLDAFAINVKYVEEGNKDAFVSAFPPNKNVTLMTFLVNASAGGFFEGPQGFTSLINPGNCNSSLSLVEIVDENGVSYTVPFRSMNVSDALTYLPPGDIAAGASPPPEIGSQCMLIFPNTNLKNGVYRAELKFNYQGEEIFSGLTFSIQRLLAFGTTVDFRGDNFGFFAPNTTVRIKLVVRDLLTDKDLPATNITSGKIIEMHKEWPEFKDVLGNTTLRNTLNESITNGTISFLAPNEEGFYSAKFRFTADVNGTTESGIGDAFFLLKKYMIWGQLLGAEKGQWSVKQGQNITLQVTVIDIDKAQTAFGYGGETMTCTRCTGFVVNVSQLRNDQQFKTVTNYSIQTGTIVNSSSPITNVTIIPGPDMQTGWYSVDLQIKDPNTNATYFGWGWFEIRNFWIETRKTNFTNATHSELTEGGFGGDSYPIGSTIRFTVLPREPGTGNLLTPTSISLENIQFFPGFSPTSITGFTSSITDKTLVQCFGIGSCTTFPGKEISISGLPTDKEGRYEANVRVTVGSVSDIGTYFFEVASYRIETAYRQNSFPPLFASTENFTVNFTATDFNNQPVNITNVTIEDFFSQKLGRPIRMTYGQNYTTACSSNLCRVNVTLNNLGTTGEFFVRFKVVNVQNVTKFAEAFFKIQDIIVSVASIESIWTWEQDTATKNVEQNVWRGEWSNCQSEKSNVSGSLKFCGNFWNGTQNVGVNITAPNVSSTKEIFGWMPLMNDWNIGRYGNVTNKSNMYMFSNGTNLWINVSTPNLTQTTPIAVNGTFTDSRGGIWKLDKIGDQDITITSTNSLYSTGVLINTSYSKSGIYKIGQIDERNLGPFTPQGRGGIDLDGNGFTNGTLYYTISDNATAGVYDLFYLSKDGNFTGNASNTLANPISVNDLNRANREVGYSTLENQRLTILSIDPRAQNVLLYSRQVGDWSYLGEIKLNNNITIPVIVASPNGTSRSVNVSVTGYRKLATGEFVQTTLVNATNITGVSELRFNTSSMGNGEFAFAIKGDETIEEWKWPRAFVRGFLIDGSVGEGIYLVNDFKPLQLKEWNWNAYGQIPRIRQDRRNASFIVNGVLVDAFEDPTGCQVFRGGTNETTTVLGAPATYGLMRITNAPSNSYYFYNLSETTLYRNLTSCFFNVTVAQNFQNGSTIIIPANNTNLNKAYNLTLYVDRNACNGTCWRADFYVRGINNATIQPISAFNGSDFPYEWAYMQNISIDSSFYDVVLANDTSYNYHRCNVESISSCVRKAWIVQNINGNFSSAVGVTIGQNFTQQHYLASVGPWDGDGLVLGNYSQLPALTGGFKGPGIKDTPTADDTLTYFAVLNETTLAFDLDKNSTLNATFYMFTFDSYFDGKKNLTSAITDDDLEIIQWTFNNSAIDFTGNENFTGIDANWTTEQWNSLPSETWFGSATFGNDYQNRTWEQQPTWNIPFYNNTHMILQKDSWRVQSNTIIAIYLTTYNFDKTKIQNANVSVKQVARSLPFIGFQILPATNYSVNTTYSTTNANGVAFLRITPNATSPPNWNDGQYQVVLNIQGPGGNETFERWFCVGSC